MHIQPTNDDSLLTCLSRDSDFYYWKNQDGPETTLFEIALFENITKDTSVIKQDIKSFVDNKFLDRLTDDFIEKITLGFEKISFDKFVSIVRDFYPISRITKGLHFNSELEFYDLFEGNKKMYDYQKDYS